jgi:hypothetical protein
MLELEVAGERVQVVLVNVPPLPPSFQVTVPVGAEGVPGLVSATVAVNVTGELLPMVSDIVLGVTVVLVLRVVVVKVAVSWMAAFIVTVAGLLVPVYDPVVPAIIASPVTPMFWLELALFRQEME